jgi:DNA-binding GntR family transcriptional regulator
VLIQDLPLLRDLVTDRLAEMIVRGDLEPGQRLSEVKLAEQLGVSRSPVREALQQLCNDGLVTYEPRKGMTVALADKAQAIPVYEYRILIQCECVRLATPLLTDEQLDELSETLVAMEKAAEQDRLHEYLQLVSRFYEPVEAACPNPVLVESVRAISRRAMCFRSVSIRSPGRMAQSLVNHRALYRALRERDAAAATELARHLLIDSLNGIPDDQPAARAQFQPK